MYRNPRVLQQTQERLVVPLEALEIVRAADGPAPDDDVGEGRVARLAREETLEVRPVGCRR